uniref:Cu/Zn-superoxide dismutase n=1 Tax=Daphnia tibetana TaxID=2172416 RepID=A0A3Q8VNU0_9CRUS|nr:Cu/Zn-superoxide dismutase [Daphnia tibetana]
MRRYQSIVIALLIAELIVTDAAVLAGSSRNKGKERVMHEGPKVLIESTALKSNIVGRHKNSDLHEIYLAPYRYIEKETKAVATFMEAAYFNNSGAVQGVVVLTQEAEAKGVTLRGNVRGLTPGKHGIRIHEFGDIRDHCRTDRTGHVYNPYRLKTQESNIEVKEDGTADFVLMDKTLTLIGGRSIIGRSIVIDQEPDDDFTRKRRASRRAVLCGVSVVQIEKRREDKQINPSSYLF